ncbi:MAG: DUF3662 domain-containing protein [Acidimicrobiia bacterium]|nr:DUF3662 domain-containing protein [Acidimicrobiia bacterium]
MNLARGLEKRLENLVDGVSASLFRGHMHPVTMAARLMRQLDFLATESEIGVEIPNDLTVVVNPADVEPSLDIAELERELASVVTETAQVNGWRLVGPVEVHLETSTEVPTGILQAAGSSIRGPLPPWGQLISDDGSAIVALSMNRTLIGRALDCDIRFSNTEVSRHHAVIGRVGTSPSIDDLGSSNGTWINGVRIDREEVPFLPGDRIVFGALPFTYRSVT